ncbi:hypothetical protein PTKIN_Ptkin10aG0053500 [Pterospermum kingtungense]
MATSLCDEYVKANSDIVSSRVSHEIAWSPLIASLLKVNVDATWSSYEQVAVIAYVTHDSTDSIKCCATQFFPQVDSVLFIELLAIIFWAELALYHDLRNIVFQSNSPMAISEVRKGKDSLCQWGGIIFDIVSLAKLLGNCKFQHAKREANYCAHHLTQVAKKKGVYSCWVEDLLGFCCNDDSI